MFRSFFSGQSSSTPEAFRARVLKFVRASYPDIHFEPSKRSVEIIIAQGIEIGLQNAKAKFDQSDRTQRTFEQIVGEHFQLAFKADPTLPNFEDAQKKLRPQIMPPEYAKQAPIISFPFGKTLAIGIVFDEEKGYRYVKTDEVVLWKKSPKELLELAISNLEESSQKLELQSADTEEVKWIGVESKDGFDAARILLPKFRGFLAGHIGSNFCFAIPNRDFLICWNTGASARFTKFTEEKVRKDFEAQPYPLSPHIFEMATDGTITERD